MKPASKNRYYPYYTLCFCAACLVVFYWFLSADTTLVWKTDGENQHFKALVYYGRYLRSIAVELLTNHRLVIPNWEFALGEGNDVLGTLHYYVIGDPLAALSVFVPTAYMGLFYNAMMVVRLYLAGTAFSCLCLHTGQKSRSGVLAGALTYVFCYWALLNAAKHPYFLNPMIYLPLLILGVEKVLDQKRPYLLIGAVFLSAVSNFYFFYILVMLTVIYVIARLLFRFRKDPRTLYRMLLSITAYSFAGVMAAAVILLPVLYAFLSDARMSVNGNWPLFYPWSYYRKLPALFFTPDSANWLCMGFSIPVFPAVCMLVQRRRQHGFLFCVTILCLIAALLPIPGKFLSACSLIGNRYSFALALAAAYTLTVLWEPMLALTRKECLFLFAAAGIELALCLLPGHPHPVRAALFPAMTLLLIWILYPGMVDGKPLFSYTRRKQIVFAFVLFSVFCNSYLKYHVDDYVSEHVKTEDLNNHLYANETAAIKKAADDDGYNGFYRYSGRSLTSNAGLIAALSSTRYYWSLSNAAVSDFRDALAMREYIQYNYMGYDDRAALLSLAGVRYYASPAKDAARAPYGFSDLDTIRIAHAPAYHIYRNDYVLPIAYTYDSYLARQTWDTLPPLKKQSAMLQAALLDPDPAAGQSLKNFKQAAPRFTDKKAPYRIVCHKDVSLKDNRFTVRSDFASATIQFYAEPDCETYLSLQGFDFVSANPAETMADLKLTASNGFAKKLTYYNANDPRRYNNRHDFTVCFGYDKEAVTSVTIRFSSAGTYSFDALEILCQPMDGYAGQISRLSKDVLKQVTIGVDSVSGSITLDRPKILCLSIPYSAGWTAAVDGKKAVLLRANLKNMALPLDAGNHRIELYYQTPLQKEGWVVSICGLFVIGVIWICTERKYKNKRKEESRYKDDE